MRAAAIEVRARSEASPEAVFAILADAPGWPRWAGPLVRRAWWEREGEPAPGGVGAVRRLGRWPVFGREEIVEYDPPRHMAYVVQRGLPVRDYRAEVDLAPDAGGTAITWRGRFEPRVPGTTRVLTVVLRSIMLGFARRLAAEAAR